MVKIETPKASVTVAGADEPLTAQRFDSDVEALGFAVTLLGQVEPFKTFPFGAQVGTLAGQIHRKHYLFAARGRELVGYAGWALCEEDVARAWSQSAGTPTYEQSLAGDCFVGMTWYADTSQVNRFLVRECRRQYPNCKVFGKRSYADGRETRPIEWFNRIEGVETPGT